MITKKRVFEIIEKCQDHDRASSVFDYFLMILISLNVIAVIVGSFDFALMTVGYGDVYPVTIPGKILSCVIALLGIGLVALPSGIISSGLLKEVSDKGQQTQICPHCGKET
ncbi:potassium channel family protein [Treponema primitia]|uniref:potassium channel family protein n=1 Tax=Treponema primitia TaxID=88058 RepID=UPI0039810128